MKKLTSEQQFKADFDAALLRCRDLRPRCKPSEVAALVEPSWPVAAATDDYLTLDQILAALEAVEFLEGQLQGFSRPRVKAIDIPAAKLNFTQRCLAAKAATTAPAMQVAPVTPTPKPAAKVSADASWTAKAIASKAGQEIESVPVAQTWTDKARAAMKSK